MFIDNRKYFHKVQYKKSTYLHGLLLYTREFVIGALWCTVLKNFSSPPIFTQEKLTLWTRVKNKRILLDKISKLSLDE